MEGTLSAAFIPLQKPLVLGLCLSVVYILIALNNFTCLFCFKETTDVLSEPVTDLDLQIYKRGWHVFTITSAFFLVSGFSYMKFK